MRQRFGMRFLGTSHPRATVTLWLVLGFAGIANANDHNNIEGGRPLRFDDAYSIAFGERALELGFSMDSFRRRSPGYGLKSEFKYGFAKNQDIGIAWEPSWDPRFNGKRFELSYMNGLAREIDNAPALGFRVDVVMEGREAEARLRGILTRSLGQFDKLHLNADVLVTRDRTSFGGVLGWSMPLGYPRTFDQTLVADFAVNQDRGDWTGSFGLGLRRQLDPRSIFDIGVTADAFGKRSSVRLTIGYSVSF